MTTHAKQWIESQISEETLPSGNVAKLRRVDLLDLLSAGVIPDTLTGQVEQLLDSNKGKLNLSLDQFKDFAEMLNIMALATFVEPRLVADEFGEDPLKNILWVGRVSTNDKIFVFEWANGDAKRVEPFRSQPTATVDGRQPGQRVLPTPIEPGPDTESVDGNSVRPSDAVPPAKSGRREAKRRGYKPLIEQEAKPVESGAIS